MSDHSQPRDTQISELWSRSDWPDPINVIQGLHATASRSFSTNGDTVSNLVASQALLLTSWNDICGASTSTAASLFRLISKSVGHSELGERLLWEASQDWENRRKELIIILLHHFLDEHLAADITLLSNDLPLLVSQALAHESLAGLDEVFVRVNLLGTVRTGFGLETFMLRSRVIHLYAIRLQCSKDSSDLTRIIHHLHLAVMSITMDNKTDLPQLFDLARSLTEWITSIHVHLETLEGLKPIIEFLKQVYWLQTTNALKAKVMDNLARLYCLGVRKTENSSYTSEAVGCHKHALFLHPGGRADDNFWLAHFGWHYIRRFESLGNFDDIQQAITHLSEANLIRQNDPVKDTLVLWRLSVALEFRFDHLGNISDLDQAIAHLIQSLALVPQREVGHRSGVLDLDSAIKYQLKNVEITPSDPRTLANIGQLYGSRYRQSKDTNDFDQELKYLSKALLLAPDNIRVQTSVNHNLASAYAFRFYEHGQREDIESAILHQLRAVELQPDQDLGAKSNRLKFLGEYYRCRLSQTRDVDDMNQSVCFHSESVECLPSWHRDRSSCLTGLGLASSRRYMRLRDPHDYEWSQGCFREAAYAGQCSPAHRLEAALGLAIGSRDSAEVLQSYGLFIELLPQVAWLGASPHRRYTDIANKAVFVADAVAKAVDAKSNDLALEWVEQGRSIIWKQQLQFRSPLDELRLADSTLADQIQQAAFILGKTEPSTNSHINDSQLDPMFSERLEQRRRRTAQEWDRLLTQARLLPGFDSFLRPTKCSELLKSAHSGAVVVLSIHRGGCNALVIRQNAQQVEHVLLPNITLEKVSEASRQLHKSLTWRNGRGWQRGPIWRLEESDDPKAIDHFRLVLTMLWFDAVKPVLEYLGYLNVSDSTELPRITWCCTGPLSFLPLHAAGDYITPGAGPRIFYFVVSSYTPALTSLVSTSNPATGFSGVLAVVQPHTPGQSPLPNAIKEVELILEIVGQANVTQLRDEAATSDHVLEAMERHSWVHLACHASQSLSDPTTSAIKLHHSELPLHTIMQREIKGADFAFLSACETATGVEMVPDEAVHLAAGLLTSGYRSVIATMWSIQDRDSPMVAEKFYRYLVRKGQPDSRLASRALHDAIAHLRESVGEANFIAWVPYIHMGC